jgi:hypothetical protein
VAVARRLRCLAADRVAVGLEDAVERFDAVAVVMDLSHDNGIVMAVGADVTEEVEVGVQQIAATVMELLDVAAGAR